MLAQSIPEQINITTPDDSQHLRLSWVEAEIEGYLGSIQLGKAQSKDTGCDT